MTLNGYTAIPLKKFGGWCTFQDPTNLPLYLSPDLQDVEFTPGLVRTRTGLTSQFSAIAGNPTVNYVKSYVTNQLLLRMLALDGFGILWKETPQGTLNNIGQIENSGIYANSVSLFGREYLALGDQRFGTSIPRQYDDINLDRVSQVGPGAGQDVSDTSIPTATITGVGGSTSATIAAAPNGALTTDLIGMTFPSPIGPISIIFYSNVLITTTTPHGFNVGDVVNIAGVGTITGGATFNGIGFVITEVPLATTFKYLLYNPNLGTGGGGTATAPATSQSMSRTSNTMSVNTGAAHGFQDGLTVAISGIPDQTVGGTISSISRTEGLVTVVTASASKLLPGARISISNVTGDLTFNGEYVVSGTPDSTSFTYEQSGTNGSGTVGGTTVVKNLIDGTFTIADIPTPTTFTYVDIGPDISITSAGVATIMGNVSAGTHQAAVSFITRSDYITPPSPPVTFVAGGGKLLAVTNIPTGPANVKARRLMFTPFLNPGTALGSFYTIPILMDIPDNTTTSILIDFSDSLLLTSESVDFLFDLEELGECAGVTEYNERLFWWGERNKVQSFLNLSFNGGWAIGAQASAAAGASSDGGGAHAWTSPANFISTTLFASITGTGSLFVSNALKANTFGFAIPSRPAGIQVTLNIQGSIGGTILSNLHVQLLKAGVPTGTPKAIILTGFIGGLAILGGPTDLWGANFDAADVNTATWGFQVTAAVGNGMGTVQVNSASALVTEIQNVPLGWSADPTYPGSEKETTKVIFGDAVRISGDGVSAIRGMISQPSFQDVFGADILLANTPYSVRARVAKSTGLIQGDFVLELFSASVGSLGLFKIINSQITTDYQEFIGALCAAQTAIPNDAVFRIYATNTPTNDEDIYADNIEVFPTLQPYLTSTLRGSEVEEPEQYNAGIDPTGNGFITAAPENGQSIRSVFRIRNYLYIIKERSMYVTADDGQNDPSLWEVNEISSRVGTLSPRGVGLGDEWAVIAAQSGLYYFTGAGFNEVANALTMSSKLSQEIQPTWDAINWQYGHLIDVKVDTKRKRIYIAAPMGTSNIPNQMLVLDYTEGFGDPMAGEASRKWCPWMIPCNSMDFILRDNGDQELFIGNNAGTGKIYSLDANATSDDGMAIDSFYQTGFFQDGMRLTFSYLTANVVGAGVCNLSVFKGDQRFVRPVRGWSLFEQPFANMDRQIQANGERMSVKFRTSAVGHNFSLQGMNMYVQESVWTPVRGVNF